MMKEQVDGCRLLVIIIYLVVVFMQKCLFTTNHILGRTYTRTEVVMACLSQNAFSKIKATLNFGVVTEFCMCKMYIDTNQE